MMGVKMMFGNARLALLFSFFTLAVFRADGKESNVQALLEQVGASQSRLDHASFDVETRIALGHLTGREEILVKVVLRRDNDRLDIRGDFDYLDPANEARSHRICSISNDRQWITYSYRTASADAPKGGVYSKVARVERSAEFLEAPYYSGALDGYAVATGGYRLAEALRKSSSAHSEGRETINGVECEVVAGDTPYGEIKLWIAVSSDFAVHKFVYRKVGQDPFWENQPIANGKSSGAAYGNQELTAWELTLDQVTLQEAGEVHFPVSGRLTETFHLADGGRVVNVYDYQRSGVQIAPDFDGTDAFQTDLPEGARLTNMDDPDSGVVYLWRDGDIKAAHLEFDPEGEFLGFTGRSRIWLIAINVCVLLLILGFIVLRRRS
jgi:hypothetical protein